MASVVFPTYFLARLVVRKVPALFAAAGAATIPALAYSSWIVEETFAYPYAALCFFLFVKALLTRSRGWVAAATARLLLAPRVREELIVIPIVARPGSRVRGVVERRCAGATSTWTTGDWVGFFALLAGLLIFISAVGSQYSSVWYGDDAVLQASNVHPRRLGGRRIHDRHRRHPADRRPLRSRAGARTSSRAEPCGCFAASRSPGIVAFGLYTGMKACVPLDGVRDSGRGAKSHLHRAAPLHRHRARARAPPGAIRARFGRGAPPMRFYLVVGTPFSMGVQLYSDALGFAILEQANRYFEWTPAIAQWLLIADRCSSASAALLGVR